MPRTRCVLSFLVLIFGLAVNPVAWATPLDLSPIIRDFVSPADASARIRRMASSLAIADDRRALFAQVYSLTIEAADQQLSNHEFANPQWITLLIVNYANLYRRTLLSELTGQRSKLPAGWQLEFDYSDLRIGWAPELDLIYGINVHIARDLVEALLVTPTRYNDQGLHRDFLLITEALKRAMPSIWIVAMKDRHQLPLADRIVQSMVMHWIGKLRRDAWDRASAAATKDWPAYLIRLDAYLAQRAHWFGLLLPLI